MLKDDISKIKEMHSLAIRKIDNGEYLSALNIAYEIKNKFQPNPYVSNVVGGLLIDIGRLLRRKEVTIEGIKLIKDDLNDIKKTIQNPSIAYYNLANGYYNLFNFEWDKEPYFNRFKETDLDKVKIYHREALEYDSSNPQIYINLGNCYDHLGRTIDALECYEKALQLKSDHGMALANKGIALCKYAFLLGKKYRTILLDAHYFISKALELGVNPESKKSFETWLKWIENHFKDKNVLKNPPNFPGYEIKAEPQLNQHIKEYLMIEKLYLNVCTFCQKCNAAIGDTINIERMKVPVNENYSIANDPYLILSSNINQIKEDYISARFLLISSRYESLELDFVYEDAKFIETWDYTIHEMNTQLLKLSFKNFYDILDKIAFFIDSYLNLNIKPWLIDFRKIWYDPWKGKPINSTINDKIMKTNSYGLNALFDLHWDFEEDGPYKDLRKTRNALTHRYVKIKMFCECETTEEMKETTFLKQTLELARIVRNAIFYLMYFVNEIETKKTQTS